MHITVLLCSHMAFSQPHHAYFRSMFFVVLGGRQKKKQENNTNNTTWELNISLIKISFQWFVHRRILNLSLCDWRTWNQPLYMMNLLKKSIFLYHMIHPHWKIIVSGYIMTSVKTLLGQCPWHVEWMCCRYEIWPQSEGCEFNSHLGHEEFIAWFVVCMPFYVLVHAYKNTFFSYDSPTRRCHGIFPHDALYFQWWLLIILLYASCLQ